MSSPEFIWAEEHPTGRVDEIGRDIFLLWNFGINKATLKANHLRFLNSGTFRRFIFRMVDENREIEIIGKASPSGGLNSRLNFELSKKRSYEVSRQIILNPNFRDYETSLTRLVVPKYSGARNQVKYVKWVKKRVFRQRPGDPLVLSNPIRTSTEGFAINRSVIIIGKSQIDEMNSSQIGIYGKRYMAEKLRIGVEDIFSFWDLWCPTRVFIEKFVPRIILPFGDNLPPWYGLYALKMNRPKDKLDKDEKVSLKKFQFCRERPGHKCILKLFKKPEYFLLKDYLNSREISSIAVLKSVIDNFLEEARNVKRKKESLERAVFINRTAGSFIGAEGEKVGLQPLIIKYNNADKNYISGDPTCILKYLK